VVQTDEVDQKNSRQDICFSSSLLSDYFAKPEKNGVERIRVPEEFQASIAATQET
jgi:hypothetical protein